MNKSEFLLVGLEAIRKAEKAILSYYKKQNYKLVLKSDKTIVTLADIEAEKIIVSTIKKYFSDHGFLGEEKGWQNKNASYQWVIDPIDGTSNFVHRLPFFGTELALFYCGKIILGISNAPLLGELMFAERQKGSYLNGKRVHVSKISKFSDAYVSFGGVKHFEKSDKLKELAEYCRWSRTARGFGDFWSHHLVAQGKIDSMAEAKVKIWDIAAAAIIVEEAG